MTRRPSTIRKGSSEPIGPAEHAERTAASVADPTAHLDYDLPPGLGAIEDDITIGIVPDPMMSTRRPKRPKVDPRIRRRANSA
jgi:hypothetical protein